MNIIKYYAGVPIEVTFEERRKHSIAVSTDRRVKNKKAIKTRFMIDLLQFNSEFAARRFIRKLMV